MISVTTPRKPSRDQASLGNANTTAQLDVHSKIPSVALPIHSKCTVNVNVTIPPKPPTPTTPNVNRNVPSLAKNTPTVSAANPTLPARIINVSAPPLARLTMDRNVPHAPLVRITTGSLEDVMPPVQRLVRPTKSLDEEKVFAVEPVTLLAKPSVAHPVPMKLEPLENVVKKEQLSTDTETVSTHPTTHELLSETVLLKFNSKFHPPISD
jgi:hypothetical protein